MFSCRSYSSAIGIGLRDRPSRLSALIHMNGQSEKPRSAAVISVVFGGAARKAPPDEMRPDEMRPTSVKPATRPSYRNPPRRWPGTLWIVPAATQDANTQATRRPRGAANPCAAARVLWNMDASHIKTKFEKLGARAKVRPLMQNGWRPVPGQIVIDVRHDRHGEFFDIRAAADADVEVLDVQPRDRHLLLMVRHPSERLGLPDVKEKLLCGHDERHWFVAGVPQRASTVVTAKEALKPEAVLVRERGKKGKRQKRLRRKTDVFIRQGEWFFIPAPDVQVNEKLILSHEPISRGGGKPHMCEQLYRDGGTTVYVCGQHPNGLTTDAYRKLLKQNPDAARWGWRTMTRNPVVVVRGRITHPDHATIRLDGWHRVVMNTESGSSSVAFLD